MLFVVRAVLEPEVARMASGNITAKAIEQLRHHFEEMLRAVHTGELAKFYLADYNFHQQMYRLAHNPFMEQACRAIAAAPFAYLLCDFPGPTPRDYPGIAEEHGQVIDALLEGPEAAVEVTKRNITKWLKWQMDFLSSKGNQA